ncbi:MAG: RNA polymerase sigma factor [candidate division WOR-3 bacterium]|nr:RNA polymerase sigma factor [candidate division WOR-3 bacterium]
MYRNLTPVELLNLAKQDDENAIAEIYQRYYPLLACKAYVILKNPEDAKDAVSETFTKFLDHKKSIKKGPLQWLLTTNRNVCYDMLKDKHYSYSTTEYFSDSDRQSDYIDDYDHFDYYQEPAINYQLLKDKHQINKILAKLPINYCNVLLLHDYQGYSCSEIAQQLGKSKNAVKLLLFRAREKFREVSQKISPWLNRKYGNKK